MAMMSSSDHALEEQVGSSLSGNEMQSDFVVLSQPPSHLEGMNDHLNDIELVLSSPDVSTEDIHQWIKELLNENIELKTSLQETNVKIKHQLDTLLAWQSQVSKTNNINKQIIEDSQRRILILQDENDTLRKNITDMESQSASLNCIQCSTLKQKNEDLIIQIEEIIHEKKDLISKLRLQEDMYNQLEKTMCELALDFSNVNEKYKVIEEEKKELIKRNTCLKSKLATTEQEKIQKNEQTPTVIEEIEQGYTVVYHPGSGSAKTFEKDKAISSGDSLHRAFVQLRESQTEVERLTETLKEGQIQVASLKNALTEKDKIIKSLDHQLKTCVNIGAQDSSNESKPTCSLEQQKEKSEGELLKLQQQLSVASSYIQNYNERYLSLQEKLKICQDSLENTKANDEVIIKQLTSDISSLQSLLTQEQAARKSDKKTIVELNTQLEKVNVDFMKLRTMWEEYDDEVNTKKVQTEAMKEIEERKHQESLDDITARLVALEEDLSCKNSTIIRLKEQIDTLKEETEQIPILKAQVEVYKQDFGTERDLRHMSDDTIKRLKAEVESLWQQNEQLLCSQSPRRAAPSREVDGTRRIPRYSSSNDRNSVRRPASSENAPLQCPKCQLQFLDLQPLQNHVDACIDRDDPFR